MKTLKQLKAEGNKILAEIREREEAEIAKVQLPYLRSLVGNCYVYRDNGYGGDTAKWDVFRKVVGYVEKDYGLTFIFEEVQVDCYGKATLEVASHYAYMNKEWHRREPFSGYVKCKESEYQTAKENTLEQIQTQSKMRIKLKKNS